MLERLQKILSAHGIASRRHAEELIEAGRVTVNGVKAILGQKADATADTIVVDGKPLKKSVEKLYYVLMKPVGYVTTNLDDETWKKKQKTGMVSHRSTTEDIVQAPKKIEKTVRELLPKPLRGKVFPVGRLDKDTSGVLLFTNDGDLAYRLTHPKFSHEREYEVEVAEPIASGALRKLQNGVILDGVVTKQATIFPLGDRLFRITITEGRNRQVRRMCSKVGSEVVRLHRIRVLSLTDNGMQEGDGRFLTPQERDALLQAVR